MLSILIPTYNYNVLELVSEVHKQAIANNIPFEILVFDDASTLHFKENDLINNFSNSTYKILPKNIGRSAIRNLLSNEASFENLLFLDADVMVFDDFFLEKYIKFIKKEQFDIVYGGIKYQTNKPNNNQLLRWTYGNEREALNADIRNKSPYVSFLTLNFLAKKSLFKEINFNENIPNLRYEDLLFSFHLMQNQSKIIHINNQVIHNGIETSEVFLLKTNDSLKGLQFLLNENLLPYNYARISRIYKTLKQWHLLILLKYIHKLFYKFFKKNLLGSKPSLFVYDIYRLGYLSTL